MNTLTLLSFVGVFFVVDLKPMIDITKQSHVLVKRSDNNSSAGNSSLLCNGGNCNVTLNNSSEHENLTIPVNVTVMKLNLTALCQQNVTLRCNSSLVNLTKHCNNITVEKSLLHCVNESSNVTKINSNVTTSNVTANMSTSINSTASNITAVNSTINSTISNSTGLSSTMTPSLSGIPSSTSTGKSTTIPSSTTSSSAIVPSSTSQLSATTVPTTPQSSATQSTAPQTTTSQSTAPQTTTSQSTTSQTTTSQPTTTQTTTPLSTTTQPTTPLSTKPQSTTAKSTEEATTTKPSTQEATTTGPADVQTKKETTTTAESVQTASTSIEPEHSNAITTMESPYNSEKNIKFFYVNVLIPVGIGVCGALLIALSVILFKCCRRNKVKKVRYFGKPRGYTRNNMDHMNLLANSSDEE